MQASHNSKVSITLPTEAVERLQELAKENQYHLAQLVRKLVLEGLKAIEEES